VQVAGLGGQWEVEYAVGESGAEGEDGDSGAGEATSQAKQLQLEFWTATRTALVATGKFASLQTPRPQHWFDIAVGRASVHMSLTANTMAGRVGVRLVLGADRADQALEQLLTHRQAIENEIGVALDWNPYPEKRMKTIALAKAVNLADRAAWPGIIDWLASTAVKFHAAFAPRAAQLDLRAEP
jgi:hypothetical protein